MVQDIRKRLLLAAGIMLGLLLALVLWLTYGSDRQVPPQSPDGSAITGGPEGNRRATTTIRNGTSTRSEQQTEEPEDIYLRQISEIFVERYGSYSNQNDNRHIIDVETLVTKKMWQYIEGQQLRQERVYQGVTTVVVANRVVKKTTQTATVHVDVQQVISSATGTATVYQAGRVELVKQNGVWKIDGLYWE